MNEEMQWIMVILLTVFFFALLYVSWGHGNRLIELRRDLDDQPSLPPPPEPEAICGCKHHKCFHDDNGKCQYRHVIKMNAKESVHGCPCLRYMGPEHLPTVLP